MIDMRSGLVLGLLSSIRPLPANTRREDFILTSYPKSGNTWVRFVFAHLLANADPDEVDFHNIEEYSPAVGGKIAPTMSSTPRINGTRAIKTHYNWSFRYARHRSILLVRDPLKCLPAFFDYLSEARGIRYLDMSTFLGSTRHGLPAWISFHRSWQRHADFVLRYEDILAAPESWIGQLVEHLRLPYDANDIKRALERSSRAEMKRAEKKGDPYHDAGYTFVRGENEIRRKTALSDIEQDLIMTRARPIYEALRSGPRLARSGS